MVGKAVYRTIEDLANAIAKDEKFPLAFHLDSNPKFLTEISHGQMNLLHFLLRIHAGFFFIQELLLRKPAQAEALLDGKLPFFILLDRADIEVDDIESLCMLLKVCPQAAFIEDDGLNALTRIFMKLNFPREMTALVKDLLARNPEAAKKKFGAGDLPLHLCLSGSKPADAVLEVLNAYRGAAALPSSAGMLPLHMCVENDMDTAVTESVLKYYPHALLELVASMNCTLLEYAIRMQKSTAVDLLMNGGSGKNPRLLAYGMAQIDGFTGEEYSFPKLKNQEEVQHRLFRGAPHEDRPDLNITFAVKPYDKLPFRVTMAADAKVEHLQSLIHLMEGTPPERQKLTNIAGGRLLHRDDLEGHLRDVPIMVVLSPEQLKRKEQLHDHFHKEEDLHLPLIHLTPNSDLFCDCIEAGSAEIALRILDKRPEVVYEQDRYGSLPVHKALQHEPINETLVARLLDGFPESTRVRSGTSANSEYLVEIAIRNYAPDSLLRRLISEIIPTDWSSGGCFCPLGGTGVEKRPLLHLALEHDLHPELIIAMVEGGYPIKVIDRVTGLSAVELAVSLHAPLPLVHYLSEENAHNTMWSGPCGKTLLHTACSSKASPDTIAHICRQGGKEMMKARDHDGRTPIHLAVEMGLAHDGVRELMICDPTALFDKDAHGRTALILAVMNDAAPGVVFELARCSRKAVKVKDALGRSLLRLAVLTDVSRHIVHELVEACPELLDEVNLFDSNWASNEAGQEAKRLALLPRPPRQDQQSGIRRDAGQYEAARHHHADSSDSKWQNRQSTSEGEENAWDSVVGVMGGAVDAVGGAVGWLFGSGTTTGTTTSTSI